MILDANAKINWTLNITGRDEKGYHLLDSLFQHISLHDTLTLEEAPETTLSVCCHTGAVIPTDESSLIMRAARLLQKESGCGRGAKMHLESFIPVCAGLGGGSADAAAALLGLNRLWELRFSPSRLALLALRLGADIPYCLQEAPMRVTGIGEKMTPVPPLPSLPLVLLRPDAGLSTADVFRAFDTLPPDPPADTERFLAALRAGDLPEMTRRGGNMLQKPACALAPEIESLAQALWDSGAGFVSMTGSGSVVFGAYENSRAADAAYLPLKDRFPVCIRTETV